MTTLDSSSGVESTSMDDISNNNRIRSNDGDDRQHSNNNNNNLNEEDGGDPQLWETFNDSFRQVQSVLDQNRVLIQQVNDNHQSKLPDNLSKNVALIREINGNISTIASLYSTLSSNFTDVFQQRRGGEGIMKNNKENQSEEAE